MKQSWLIVATVVAMLVLSSVVCKADNDKPDDAVKKAVGSSGHPPERGNTDIGGDGYGVMPVRTEKNDGKIHVSGEILHTWNHYDPTHIKYDIIISPDGTIAGTLTVPKPNNPDNTVITKDVAGKLTGSVDDLKRDILSGQSKMDHATTLIQKVLKLVKTNPPA